MITSDIPYTYFLALKDDHIRYSLYLFPSIEGWSHPIFRTTICQDFYLSSLVYSSHLFVQGDSVSSWLISPQIWCLSIHFQCWGILHDVKFWSLSSFIRIIVHEFFLLNNYAYNPNSYLIVLLFLYGFHVIRLSCHLVDTASTFFFLPSSRQIASTVTLSVNFVR